MRRHFWVIGVFAVLAACTPSAPPATVPTQPVITSFTATRASGTAPLTTALQWVISDANYDSLSCQLDADGDGTFETSVPFCNSSSVRTANFLTPGVRTLTLKVTDGNTAPVTQTLIVAATEPSPDTFHIDLRLNAAMTPSQQATFINAAARWEQIIKTGLPDTALTIPANDCDTGTDAFSGTVDDLMIDASIVPIDGVGAILGSAGPCYVRSGSQLPIYGTMRFDVADVAQLESSGQFTPVILHVMGHVLGFGTVWSSLGVILGSGGGAPVFTGNAAIGEYQTIGGFGLVPIEGGGGPGTANSHWSELTFNNELMTGYINTGSNPLSRITAASLADLGYGVDLTAADPYGLPALREPSATPPTQITTQILTPRHTI